MNKKIKILQTIRQGQIGGGETHVLDLVSSLDKTVFDVEVLSFTEGPMVEKLKSIGITVHIIKTTKPFNFFVWPKITKLLKEREIDIVHAHGTRAASNCLISCKLAGIPILYTVHGWSFHKGQNTITNYLRKLGEKLIIKNTTQTITVSKSNLNDGKKFLNLSNGLLIYNSINTSKFNPTLTYSNIRKELNISSKTTLVGFIARMTYQKDPFTLLKAISIISKENIDIHFLIVGNGELENEIKEMANKNEINHLITFLNFRSDIPTILSAIDIYCLPSLWEGLPIGILEAMAMGKPVITTPVDGNTELIIENTNGLFIEPNNSKQLANNIIFLHHNRSIRLKMGEQSLSIISTKFTINKMVYKIQDLYKSHFKYSQNRKRYFELSTIK